jgi:hypothetical protein
MSRREMHEVGALGFGSVALSFLGGQEKASAAFAAQSPHFAPRAKSVIFMMQNGGPGQMDLFDPKPELAKFDGKIHSEKVEMFQPGSEQNRLLASPIKFRRYGACGMEMAEIIPHIGARADDICLVRSMVNFHNNHTESLMGATGRPLTLAMPATCG